VPIALLTAKITYRKEFYFMTPNDMTELEDLIPDEGHIAPFGEDILAELPEPTAEEEAEAKTALSSKPRRAKSRTAAKKNTRSKKAETANTTDTTKSVPVESEEKTSVNYVEAALARKEEREARQEDNTTIGAFSTAMRTRAIMEGEVSGVEIGDGNAFWLLYQNNVTVRIPFEETFMKLPQSLLEQKTSRTLLRRKQFLGKSLGATIPFIVTDLVIEPDGSVLAIGSRTAAMARIRNRHFGNNAPQKLVVGQDIIAQVISGDAHTAYVYACGCYIRVPNYMLTHRYIEDMTASYMIGSTIKLRVMAIDIGADGLPELQLSGRPVELEACKPNLRRIRGEKPRYQAIVTSIKRDTRSSQVSVVANLWLKGVDVPAFARDFRLNVYDEVHTGDIVSFECHGVTQNGYVHGKIVRYNHTI
jgi:hypothetical protein